MSRSLAAFLGFLLGAIAGFTAAIAYDTSAQTAALEGGRGHLAFGAALLFAGAGAAIGAIGASIFYD